MTLRQNWCPWTPKTKVPKVSSNEALSPIFFCFCIVPLHFFFPVEDSDFFSFLPLPAGETKQSMPTAVKSKVTLQKELDAALAKIVELEAKVAALSK